MPGSKGPALHSEQNLQLPHSMPLQSALLTLVGIGTYDWTIRITKSRVFNNAL